MGIGVDSGLAPTHWPLVSSDASSIKARGQPSVSVTMRVATRGSRWPGTVSDSSSTATGGARPVTSSVASPANFGWRWGDVLKSSRITMPSAPSLRPTNPIASSEAKSIHSLSSTMHSKPWVAAASASSVSVANPTRNGSAFGRSARPSAGAQSVALRQGKLVKVHQKWEQEPVQRRVAHVVLGLDPRDPEQPKRRRCLSRVVQEGGLTHSGVAVKDEGAAQPFSRRPQQAVESGSLVGSVKQHGPVGH